MKSTYCHHCDKLIAWNQTYPDKKNSHWAHATLVYNGVAHSIENAQMDQRCANGQTWATPKRAVTNRATTDYEPDALGLPGDPAEYGDS